MARYAISAEGATSMRALGKQLFVVANSVLEAASVLEAKVSGVEEGLGIYGTEISGIVQQNRNTLKNNRNDIIDLAQRIQQKAAEIDELVSFNWGESTLATGATSLSGGVSANELINLAPTEERPRDLAASRFEQSMVNNAPIDTLNNSEENPSHKTLSPEEVNKRWASVIQSTNEVIDNYRSALTNRGIPRGKLLEKFLKAERAKMLNYEAAALNQASGYGEVSDNDEYIYRIAGATGEYGYDSLTKEYGSFCVKDVARWIKDVNPNYYSPFMLPSKNPYHVNCGSCAFAVDTRLSGGDDLVASKTNIGSDCAMEAATGKRCVYMSVDCIEDYLRNQGPGSHLIVGINRGPAPNGCPQSGHWFNALYDGENFHTIDGQSGEILEWPYDYGDVIAWCALI